MAFQGARALLSWPGSFDGRIGFSVFPTRKYCSAPFSPSGIAEGLTWLFVLHCLQLEFCITGFVKILPGIKYYNLVESMVCFVSFSAFFR